MFMWKVTHQCPFTMSNKKVLLQIFKYFLSCPAIICVDFNLLIFIYVFVCWLASHLYASGFYNFNTVVFMVFRSLMWKSYYIFACKIFFFLFRHLYLEISEPALFSAHPSSLVAAIVWAAWSNSSISQGYGYENYQRRIRISCRVII